MNKKLIASVAAACVLSAGSVFAASNPFADVPANHWSYSSVQSLAKAGIIDGYGDGTFKGDKTITRYEMAQLVGKAMYRSDKANAEQKAAIDKLAAEYKDELDNLGVRVGKVEKKTAGVSDVKMSGWFSSENTVGTSYDDKDLHEYAIHARVGFEKQINDKLSSLVQFRTLNYFDSGRSSSTNTGGDVAVGTRLAYLTYKASPDTTVTVGKNAYWMAGGLLMDDFVTGVSVDTKLSDKVNLMVMAGRYGAGGSDSGSHTTTKVPLLDSKGKAIKDSYGKDIMVDQDGTVGRDSKTNQNRILGASITTNVGGVDLGAHYLTGNRTINTLSWNPITDYKETKIIAGTAGYTFPGGVNLQLGYAENTAADDNNKTAKIQLYKNIGGTDVIAQYWDQGNRMDWVAETGNHMAWWGQQYTGSLKGYRLILERKIMDNTVLTVAHGDYKNKETDLKGRKDTVQVTVSF
jgi:hypothetical protein